MKTDLSIDLKGSFRDRVRLSIKLLLVSLKLITNKVCKIQLEGVEITPGQK